MLAKRILWPTDFFDSDREALTVAGQLANSFHAELLVLHAIGDLAEEVYEEKSKEGKDRAAWALWKIGKEKVEKRLDELVEQTLPGFKRYRVLTPFGDPGVRILETVREESVDLIVLAARREKSLLQEMLLGSVAYKVVRTAPCSVLLVK
ncbi:MAG TPA: universal stress protein [Candidatus Binatia bacterium]|nr:universal stress protein [Candidatus Binatia bacterium]